MRILTVLMLLLWALPAQAATRAYVMNGMVDVFGSGNGISAGLRDRGEIVTVGSWTQSGSFTTDACAHRADHIIIVGHSMGALAAAKMATDIRACGVRSVRVVMIDPPTDSSVAGGNAVNFVGPMGGRVAGAQNIAVPGYGHLDMARAAAMQRRILQAAY